MIFKEETLFVNAGISVTRDLTITVLELTICRMEIAKYTVILADSKNIEELLLKWDGCDKNIVFVNAPITDDQIYILNDEGLKYSILSGKGIIKKCNGMEKISIGGLVENET
jgi:hypothetical protein